jgi:predicted GH43/DUF377 family glycosyl hydrolase
MKKNLFLKGLIVILIVGLIFTAYSISHSITKISKSSIIQDKGAAASYYLAKKDLKFVLSLYTQIFPENLNKALKIAVSKLDLKAIDNISMVIPDPYYRDQNGASAVGLLSTLINIQKQREDNYYNLDQNNPLKSSDINNSIGFKYLEKYKIDNKQESFATKVHDSTSMIKSMKLLKIPGLSKAAYNPAILAVSDGYIMAFRIDNFIKFYNPSERYHNYTSDIAMVKLDMNFKIVGKYTLISNHINGCPNRCSVEDPRLIAVNDKIYMVYNRGEAIATKDIQSNRKMYLSEIQYDTNEFSIVNTIALISPFQFRTVERNWVPFVKEKELYLIYSTEPNLVVIKPNLETGISEVVSDAYFDSKSNFGQIKGGTPLVEISSNKYLGFFHSNIDNGKKRIYYIIPSILDVSDNKYRFTSILRYPLFLDLYSFPDEMLVSLLFPSGLIIEGNDLVLSLGKNDGEILLMRLDKKHLFKELRDYSNLLN